MGTGASSPARCRGWRSDAARAPVPGDLDVRAGGPRGAGALQRADRRSKGARYVVAAPIGGSDWRVGMTEPTSTLYPADVGSQWWVIWAGVRRVRARRAWLPVLCCGVPSTERRGSSSRRITSTRSTPSSRSTNAELNAFSYSVSHDLRAPLRAIDGFSRIVIEDDDGALTDAQRRYLGLVRNNTQVMGTLIDDLLVVLAAGQPAAERARRCRRPSSWRTSRAS